MDENNSVVDAADLVLTVELAQIPLLLKYDWVLASQTIKGEDTATPDLKDDIHRFNSDLTWQVDWGFIFSSAALETLNSIVHGRLLWTELLSRLYLPFTIMCFHRPKL